jgi:hypothetical protein
MLVTLGAARDGGVQIAFLKCRGLDRATCAKTGELIARVQGVRFEWHRHATRLGAAVAGVLGVHHSVVLDGVCPNTPASARDVHGDWFWDLGRHKLLGRSSELVDTGSRLREENMQAHSSRIGRDI